MTGVVTDEERLAIIRKLAVIKARLAVATPGPWSASHGTGYQVRAPDGTVVTTASRVRGVQAADDAAFIAHARRDVDELVRLVEWLLAQ